MKFKTFIWPILFMALGVFIGWLLWANKPPVTYTLAHTDTITQKLYDTTTHRIKVPVPTPGDTIYIPVPANIDTQAVLKQYYAHIYYADTITDTNLVATIIDSIAKNSIIYRHFTYKWLQPQVINQVINQYNAANRWELYASCQLATYANRLGMGGGFTLLSPGRWGLGANYDFITNTCNYNLFYRIKK
jgi:hypothetical protein